MSQQVVDNKKADADNKGDPGVGLGVGTPQKAQQVSAFKTETLILRLFVWNSWIQDCAHTLAETNQWTQAETQVERDPWTRHVNGSQGAIACPLKVCVSLHGYVPDYH